MKKTLLILLVFLLVGVLVACTEAIVSEEASPPVETERPMPEEAPERPVSGVTQVQVQHVPDEVWDLFEDQPEFLDLNQFDSYHEFLSFEEAPYVRVAITTQAAIQNFRFVAVERHFEEERETLEMTILYALEELSPETPFVAQVLFHCFTSNRGMIFFDEEYGRDRFFTIFASGYDGALLLMEEIEENDRWIWLRSPRTAVIGILENPERPWTSISVMAWMDPQSHEWLGEEGPTHILRMEDANRVMEILSTIEATEVLSPFHNERQPSNPFFTLEITCADGDTETIFTTDMGTWFLRFTDTFGSHGDPGYVVGMSEALFELLKTYF